MKEYIVIAQDEPAIDSLHQDLTKDTREDLTVNPDTIPFREVEVADYRIANPRITHYYLTDQEAETLANDPRVVDVHPAPDPMALKKTIIDKPIANNGRIGNYSRNSLQDKFNVNWGLRRTSLTAAESVIGNTYEYNNTGSGVDIIIVDDGVLRDHPEFIDATGQSRVQEIDWYTETGIPGTMPPGHYVADSPGSFEHGTHVASIAAGKTFGYAKNSRIYSIRIFGNTSQAIKITDVFDIIRIWHSKKPKDPNTGFARPTVCNLSWVYGWEFPKNSIDKIFYRNKLNNFPGGTGRQVDFGQTGIAHGMIVPSLDIELQDAERAGVVFVQSAGNFSQKIDINNGVDYNNYYTSKSTWAGMVKPGNPIYYHRGSSPRSDNIIKVSAARDIPKTVKNKLFEQVDSYSDKGPGCQIVAPGTNITAATSPNTRYKTSEYVWSEKGTRSQYLVSKQSGTSMAAPQVTGVVALYLSSNPSAKPAQVKEWIQTTSVKDIILSSNSNSDWSNLHSLLGGPNQFLYNPYRKNYK